MKVQVNVSSSHDFFSSPRNQAQYIPDVQMTEKQLTQWRREMRRVRNREAAAASRKKVRDRIDDLENRASKWRSRYEDVINRIGEAERERLGLPTAEDYDAEDAAPGDEAEAAAKRKKLSDSVEV